MLRYSMLIQWSDKDQKYLVALPEWKGRANIATNFVARGDTYEEAAKHGREVLETFIKHAQEDGDMLPKPDVAKYSDEEQVEQPTTRRNIFDRPQTNCCSFCDKPRDQVQRLTEGPGNVNICNECIDVCREVIENNGNLDDMRLEIAKRSRRDD